jgi:hypothetical protein
MATELKRVVSPSGGDYTSLEACLHANEKDLVAADQYFNIEISGDWTGAPDTTPVTLHNYGTDATRNIRIYATDTAKHDGTYYKASAYQLRLSSGSFAIGSGGNYLHIYDVVFSGNNTNSYLFWEQSNFTGAIYERIIICNVSSGGYAAILGDTSNSQLRNSIIYNGGRGVYGSASTAYVYNCTVFGGSYGIRGVIAKNNYVGSTGTACYGSLTSGSSNNIGSDTTGDTDNQSSYSSYFTSVTGGAEDFHLRGNGTSLWGVAGTNLSAIFPGDMDSVTRGAWDNGAFEFEEAVSTGQAMNKRWGGIPFGLNKGRW